MPALWFSLILLVGAESGAPRQALSLQAYLQAYQQRVNSVPQAQLDVAEAEVDVARRLYRGTQNIDGRLDAGPRAYHFRPSGVFDPLFDVGGTARYVWATDDGANLSVTGQLALPSTNRLGRTVRYGLNAEYVLPLLRNFGGREFDYEASVFEQRAEQARAFVVDEKLAACADGSERFAVRYAALRQQSAYNDLLIEKRKVWRQTAADYRRQMITRLDLLSAKSDWIFAQSLAPGFDARAERSFAALAAFADVAPSAELLEPVIRTSTTVFEPTQHPRVRALDAEAEQQSRQVMLAHEQGRSDLGLAVSGGVDRVHDVFDPQGGAGDVTDLRAFIGLRFVVPIERPDIAYRVEIAQLRLRRLKEQRTQLLRNLSVRWAQAEATRLRETEAFALREKQLEVLRAQIRSAFVTFRDGKLEFQNYLDHWDRYQNARLDLWERWLAIRLAEITQLSLLSELPEVCNAFDS